MRPPGTATGRSSRSIVRRSPRGYSSPSSSATRRGPSPARTGGSLGNSSVQTTIYLDEIAELPLALQAKLLHVLQDFLFSRVGGDGLIDVNTRVIAGANSERTFTTASTWSNCM